MALEHLAAGPADPAPVGLQALQHPERVGQGALAEPMDVKNVGRAKAPDVLFELCTDSRAPCLPSTSRRKNGGHAAQERGFAHPTVIAIERNVR
jgi:hypothetical protein